MPIVVTRLVEADEWVNKQVRGVEGVGRANYEAGVQRPRKSPIQASIDAQQRYEEQMRNPQVLARRVTGLRGSSDDEWLANSLSLGAARIVEGVRAREGKIRTKVTALRQAMVAHLQTIDRLPNATDADRENRMIQNKRGLQALKGRI